MDNFPLQRRAAANTLVDGSPRVMPFQEWRVTACRKELRRDDDDQTTNNIQNTNHNSTQVYGGLRVMPHQELVWRVTACPAPGSGGLRGAAALSFANATAEAKERKAEG